MDHLPIFLDVRDRKVVVDGGATTAARRVERALDAGAIVHVFDPAPTDELRNLVARDGVTFHPRVPTPEDFHGCLIAYGASEDPKRDKLLHSAAKHAGALVNVADTRQYCDFITPSIVDRSPVTVAISTSGTAPIIARILRARIEALLPAQYGRLAGFLSQFRALIESHIPNGRARRRYWERVIEGPIGDAVIAQQSQHAEHLIDLSLRENKAEYGAVWIVGTGSGDPDLLTFKALGIMQRADIVLHDTDAPTELLALTRRDATRAVTDGQDVGRALSWAQSGERVVWLVPSDPTQSPKRKDALCTLKNAGVEATLIPGIAAKGYSVNSRDAMTSPEPSEGHPDHAMSLAPRTTL